MGLLIRISGMILWMAIAFSSWGQTVDTIKVWSKSMHKDFPTIIIIPDSVDSISSYPVLYLLHGYSGKYDNWITKVPVIQELANKYHIIIVCPDGGYSSWYLDSPIDSSIRYETFISQELVTAIDSRYPTLPNPSSRAITGLSMGGHGALYLLIKHPKVYGAGGSMSGGVDIMHFPDGWDLPQRLGSIMEHPKNWIDHSVFHQAIHLQHSHPALILDCGTDDFFYLVNQDLHYKLTDLQINHDFVTRPGGHTWDYWANAIHYQLLFFHRFFYPD